MMPDISDILKENKQKIKNNRWVGDTSFVPKGN